MTTMYSSASARTASRLAHARMSLADALEGKKWEAAAPLITSGAAREKTKYDGNLPLHVAVRNQAPAELVAQLVAAYPRRTSMGSCRCT